MRYFVLILFVSLAVTALCACGQPSGVGPKAVYSSCTGFLEPAEVEEITGVPGISVTTQSYPRGTFSEKFPTREDCHLVFESEARGVFVQAMRYDTPEEALEPYTNMKDVITRNQVESGVETFDGGEITWSGAWTMVNANRNVVSIQDSRSGGGPLITESSKMLELARLISRRLP